MAKKKKPEVLNAEAISGLTASLAKEEALLAQEKAGQRRPVLMAELEKDIARLKQTLLTLKSFPIVERPKSDLPAARSVDF